MNVKAPLTALSAAALGFGLAGCGSSKAPGVVLAPSAGATSVKLSKTTATSTTASTTTPTTTTPAVSTPKTGPLSKEPVITRPTGAAPKKLVIKDLVTGTGAAAKSGSSVTVNYVGELYSNQRR